MKIVLTTTVQLDSQGSVTVTSEGDAYSDDWEDVRDHWLQRHAVAIASLSTMKVEP